MSNPDHPLSQPDLGAGRVKGQAEPKPYAVPILRHFKHDHLPPHLASVSSLFASLADFIVHEIKNGAERQVALRKLLEAKDAAVRAVLEES